MGKKMIDFFKSTAGMVLIVTINSHRVIQSP